MNNRKARQSLIDKVNADLNSNQDNYNRAYPVDHEENYEDFKTEEIKVDKVNKSEKGLFNRIKNSSFLNKIWNTFFSSKHIENKTIRYFDRFLKVCFNICFLGLIIIALIIITSPNQFTKELIYRNNDTIVYDRKNKEIGKISQKRENGENVLNISYDEMNQGIINSVVGTEDATFFKHHGSDIINTLESGFKTVILRNSKAGGSSITQQIIGETHVGRIGNSSVTRKIREIFLSGIAETQLSKTQILTSYLNYFEFGQGNVRGIELASKYFFDHSVYEIDYVQSSILVGTLNMPSAANPLGTATENGYVNESQNRLEDVLLANKNQGYIKDSEYYLLQQVKVANEVNFNKKTTSNPYQAYIDVVADELQTKYKVDPFVKSLKVYTTMDTSAQKYANELTKKKHVSVPNDKLNFGFIVSKTQTGEIVALSGGKQYRKNGAYLFNNAIDNAQHPGSAFKPIIDYSPTFEFLHWGDRTPISNARYYYPNTGQEVYNHDRTSGGIFTMDQAIATSRNLTALRAMEAVYEKEGFATLTEYLNRFGFNFNSSEVVPAYGLGGLEHGVTPLQMNAAYQTFGNGGYYIEPFTIREFVDESENVTKNTTEKKKVIDEKTAFMTSTTLERSTKVSGTYVSTANYNSSPYAAKTGTSNWDDSGEQYGIPNLSPKDTWFVGYTTEYTMSSWGGYDTKDIEKGYYPDYASGAHDYSAKLWGAMMNKLSNGKEKSWLEMDLPEGIVKRSFDTQTPPPYKVSYSSSYNNTGYFYADNVPKGYSNTFDSSSLNVKLSASQNSVSATFSSAPNGYTQHLKVGSKSASGSSSLSLSANDYDIVSAYFSHNGKQYATTSKCYFNGKLYNNCPKKQEEDNNDNNENEDEENTEETQPTSFSDKFINKLNILAKKIKF
ncbi:membrane peptidoglycan carboxypeptidase [Bacilli bacterium PM5-3]|nr:membrane peptidoglycan carboxypeptidase [Bacilli bacterium PM5-3]MDH6603806.1 membrane peptidoglycan carboxypeptidase [Bacilli bacterium PM5-9]